MNLECENINMFVSAPQYNFVVRHVTPRFLRAGAIQLYEKTGEVIATLKRQTLVTNICLRDNEWKRIILNSSLFG